LNKQKESLVLNIENSNRQILALLRVVAGDTAVSVDSPLAAIAKAVIVGESEVASGNMSLSAFNVRLSQEHGAARMPNISFPALSSKTDVRNAITSAVEDFLVQETGLSSNIATALRYVSDEIIDNITEHADTPLGYINASWDGEAVTVCIADGGKTIFGSYLDKQFDGIASDQAALHAAVTGVSTKNRPGAENRGFGISTSADMVIRGLDSAMVILSGRGLLIRNKERNDFTELPEPIYMPGTLVAFTLPVRKDGFIIYDYIGG
jgi:hypothetical protein